MVALASLFLRIIPVGLGKTTGQIGALSGQWKKLQGKMGPQVEALSASFKKFATITAAAFGAMLLASPRLRAEMSLLTFRVRELVRPFGDALAPAIRIVTDLIEGMTDFFKGLPEPIQNVITFAASFTVVIGLLAAAVFALTVVSSPLLLVVVGIGLALGVLAQIWSSNWLNIRSTVEAIVTEIIRIIGGVIESITNIPGVFVSTFSNIISVINDIGLSIGSAIRESIIRPIEGFFAFLFSLGPDLLLAGQEFIGAFFRGAQAAMAGAGELLDDVLNFLFGFFGGSLPERGPLVGIPRAGEELGEAYSTGISRGIDSTNINESFTRVFNIRNVNVAMPAAAGSPRNFADRLDTGLRRSTSW